MTAQEQKKTTVRKTGNSKARPTRQELEERWRSAQSRITSLTEDNRQLKRKIFDLYTIFEISRNFNAVLDYNTLLDTFLLTSLAQVGASRAAVYIKESEQTDKFILGRFKGSEKGIDRTSYFSTDTELVSYITRLNRPVMTGDLISEVANFSERKILRWMHPGLVVPLIYQTRLSGILIITDKISGQDFQMDDIEFLSILGNQISVAIENSLLYESEKETSAQLRKAQQQLVVTERLAALGEMSAKIAHEVNNPLGIIKNYLLLINRTAGSQLTDSGYLDIVSQEIDRIARIVKQLLDFYRPAAVDQGRIDLPPVIDDVLTLMERQLQKCAVKVEKEIEAELPAVYGSVENLKQVFINLIINACDAMSDGGQLTISGRKIGDTVHLHFCDTGPGIPSEIIPRIFEPFFTTKDSGKGTGLGLSVCYGIIKKHGGTITYKNIESGGCFEVTLPIAKEDS